LETLKVLPLDEITVAGFGGQVLTVPTYRVEIAIQTLSPVIIEVLGHAAENFVLLGRDLLNHYRVVLDGPQLFLEIS
jgi:hypothetical protein